jgi:SAM-dependent methyltransferase
MATAADMDSVQKEQERDYAVPAHWMLDRTTDRGRLYFGYLDLARSFLPLGDTAKLSTLRVFDAGAGDGRFSKELVDTGIGEVHSADYSDRAVAFGKMLVPETNFIVADLVSLPYPNEHFDYIFFIETLEHIYPPNIPELIRGLHRVLKKGGKLIITVPSDKFPPGPKHYQHFNPESLTKTVGDGFEVRIHGQDYIPFHPFKLFYRAIHNKFWDIPALRTWYNTKIWQKHFNACDPAVARRLVAECIKR